MLGTSNGVVPQLYVHSINMHSTLLLAYYTSFFVITKHPKATVTRYGGSPSPKAGILEVRATAATRQEIAQNPTNRIRQSYILGAQDLGRFAMAIVPEQDSIDISQLREYALSSPVHVSSRNPCIYQIQIPRY